MSQAPQKYCPGKATMRAGTKELRCATGQGAKIIPQVVKNLTSG